MMAWVAFISWMEVGMAFAYSTERLSRRVRYHTFRFMLAQDMSFFDAKSRSIGGLTSLLSASTEDLTGLSGPVIGGVLAFISTIVTGIILSIAIGWKLALICTACIPLVVACGWIRLQMLAIVDTKVRQSGKESAAYATELVRSVKTVASLGMEESVLARYDKMLARYASGSLRSVFSASILYAASQLVTLFCAALIFWYGGMLIADREYTLFQFYICFVALISGSQIAATIFSYAPDASKAMHASQELKEILEHIPHINSRKGTIALVTEKDEKGCTIQLHNTSVRYPSRPERPSLTSIDLQAHAGQTIALVGPSGCGKSTIISLLERFYDPETGTVQVEGINLPEYNIGLYRRHIALVGQEPFLFSGSIRENIAMGIPDTDTEIDDARILDVCKQANIFDFVTSLP